MSDFTSNFWSIYIAGITILSVIACLVLLWISGQTKAMTDSDNTTGHVWDGDLREMNNPLPHPCRHRRRLCAAPHRAGR